MDLITIAAIVQAAAVVVGVVFGLMQIREFQVARRRTAAYTLMSSMVSPQVLRAMLIIDQLPDDAPKTTVDALPFDQQAELLGMLGVWESLGILVHAGEIPLGMVDDFFSGNIHLSHRKLHRYVVELRAESGRETRWEWFEWLADRMSEREALAQPVPAHVQYRKWKEPRP